MSTRFPNQVLDFDIEDAVASNEEYRICVDIFDDIIEKKQSDNSFLFTRGRKKNNIVF